jgi:hypothetical protein
MTYGRIIDEVKYIYLTNDNELKKKSLYDNLYFTLRDIFANASSLDTIMEANSFNSYLSNNICFEGRSESFQYQNIFYEKDYVEQLHEWIKHIDIYYFKFNEPEEDEEIDMKKYMKWHNWWVQFEELRKLIHEQYEKYC